ncbi:fused MFS/spermidine synthase [Nitrosomonas ureae]|uniref:Uncharacterized protein n=1 Tax=Nitrosomonas ureae TaxID=44577 RepID=A0A1H5YED1_9PROT|nr:fused MFS/spermidine synthase [Nitrosomonas ureae]SEG22378.1 hypothetical protein SAMN05216334_1521 [Nitrosomonas ureae]
MVIELLGTRLIAPFYGASLYVWTSLIAVTLIALAIGYYLGGIWADRTRSGLSLIIAIAELLTLIIPWLTGSVLLATGSIYAISTVDSVIGTLFLGFYLFPLVSSREIFMSLGIALLVLAMTVAWIE